MSITNLNWLMIMNMWPMEKYSKSKKTKITNWIFSYLLEDYWWIWKELFNIWKAFKLRVDFIFLWNKFDYIIIHLSIQVTHSNFLLLNFNSSLCFSLRCKLYNFLFMEMVFLLTLQLYLINLMILSLIVYRSTYQ